MAKCSDCGRESDNLTPLRDRTSICGECAPARLGARRRKTLGEVQKPRRVLMTESEVRADRWKRVRQGLATEAEKMEEELSAERYLLECRIASKYRL